MDQSFSSLVISYNHVYIEKKNVFFTFEYECGVWKMNDF